MTILQNKIYEFIQKGASTNEICNNLKITEKQLYYYLSIMKNYGIVYNTEFSSDGLRFLNNTYIVNPSENLFINNYGSNKIKTIVISDLHLGYYKSTFKTLNYLFEYAVKNGIHIIIICGDILNGENKNHTEFLSADEQIEYFIKNYPYDKSISTIGIIGNHEKVSFVINKGINPTIPINLHRPDVYLLDKLCGNLIIKDAESGKLIKDVTRLDHRSTKTTYSDISLVIKGHQHRYTVSNCTEDTLIICVPAFLNDSINKNKSALCFNYPEFLVLTYHIDSVSLHVTKIDVNHYAFINNIIPTQLSSADYLIRSKKKN